MYSANTPSAMESYLCWVCPDIRYYWLC